MEKVLYKVTWPCMTTHKAPPYNESNRLIYFIYL